MKIITKICFGIFASTLLLLPLTSVAAPKGKDKALIETPEGFVIELKAPKDFVKEVKTLPDGTKEVTLNKEAKNRIEVRVLNPKEAAAAKEKIRK